jgi:excisionase family DNA binding protein
MRDTYFTVDQVAEILHLHPETVREWIRSGNLKGFRVGGRKAGHRVAAADLQDFIDSRREQREGAE